MQRFRLFISTLSFGLLSLSVYGQSTAVDFKGYQLDKTATQNKSIFKFWVGNADSTGEKLIVERIYHNKSTIVYDDFIRGGMYHFADRNDDGYKDFITNYHDFDVIYFFSQKANNFKDTPVYMPATFGLVDSVKRIYWGYRDAQYAEAYDYSILYSYVGITPRVYYKIVYKTPDGHSERRDVNKIELYKFQNKDYAKPILVRTIKAGNLKQFTYRNFWRANYRQLLGYR